MTPREAWYREQAIDFGEHAIGQIGWLRQGYSPARIGVSAVEEDAINAARLAAHFAREVLFYEELKDMRSGEQWWD